MNSPRSFCARRGVALIIVLGVLVIFALMSTVFVSLQGIERSVSQNYVDGVRARLLAQSGVEDAVQRMRPLLAQGADGLSQPMWRYYGKDNAESGDPDLMAVPVEKATNPSFAYENEGTQNPLDANVTPRTVLVNGVPVGMTGFPDSGTYGAHTDFYSVRIADLQGLLHINDGMALGPTGSVSQNLKRILNNLGAQVGVPGLGDTLVTNRPPGGYRSVQQLRTLLDDSSYAKVKDFLTTHAWVDKSVANPVPFSASMLSEYPVQYYRDAAIYRYGRGKNASGKQIKGKLGFSPPTSNGSGNTVYALDELNPQWIEIVERAPVNVNTAPKEVLIALLDGLKGVFMVERRGNNVPGWQSAYNWLPTQHTYDASGTAQDELGYLYQTVPIVGPGSGTTPSGISAETLASHIIACREKKAASLFDYASVNWSGPFRTWRQFNRFCDNLVTIGLLVDNRPLYFDVASNGALYSSAIQKKIAAHAIADVLKANFNPNLHLNELNPNSNLFTWVDKTDLVVNSTEFCFLPMGYFTIESLGRIVRPIGSDDAFTAADNQLVAEKKVMAVVTLYDAYRETTQKQYYAGTLAPRQHLPLTNNNRSIEIGPEPDQGSAASENEWDGYLALPTVGGHALAKAKNSLTSTPQGTPEMGSALHGHFAYDFLLHHHVDNYRQELASETVVGESVVNVADRTETIAGPYAPTTGGGNVYRMARSFRIPTSGSPPALIYRAPLDLRLDGAYSERHSAPAYWLSPNVFGPSIGASQGVLAMWVKPSFFPEMSGKPRIFGTADRFHTAQEDYCNPSPFMLFYTASQDTPAYAASTTEGANPAYNSNPFGVSPFRPMSLGFGYGYSGASGYGGGTIAEGGCLSPTLNHVAHPDADFFPSPMRGHQWMHVVVTWQTQNKNTCTIYVNGQLLTGTKRVWYGSYKPNSPTDWTKHDGGSRNSLRLGAVSKYRNTTLEGYSRNWPADATIDEVYLWNSLGSFATAISLWQQGRYYKPEGAAEGVFTSAEVNPMLAVRSLPIASTISPPYSTTSTTSSTVTPVPPKTRILGASWTWYGDGVDSGGDEVMVDHATGQKLHPGVKVSIVSGTTVYGPYSNAGYSPIVTSTGPLDVEGAFRYRVTFSIPDAQMDSILLSTPVFDDITIFYQVQGSDYESYVIE